MQSLFHYMKITKFNKGIISSFLGSFWWGFIGTFYFQYITFIGTFEVVVHRSIWTFIILLLSTTFFNKWNLFMPMSIFNCRIRLFLAFIQQRTLLGGAPTIRLQVQTMNFALIPHQTLVVIIDIYGFLEFTI